MNALLEMIKETGILRWILDVFVIPLLVLFLIFGLRWVYLRATLREGVSEGGRRVRQQASEITGLLLSLAVVTLYWRSRLAVLAASTAGAAEERAILVDWLGGVTNAVIATVFLVLLLLGVNRTFHFAVSHVATWKEARTGVRMQGVVVFTPARVRQFIVLCIKIVRFVFVIALLYVYVPLVLSFIPATRSLAGQVVPLVIAPVRDLGLAFLRYLPRLVSMILIIIVVRYFLRILSFIMEAVERGAIRIPGFDAEWADQTERLAKIVVVLGTLMILYPFLPGAGSEVFKGFSLFVGALFTLGASSSVSNLISGVILTYTRSFRIGDRIQVGETTGDVITRGLFVSRLRTIYNEEVTVPNNVALGGRVVNYSSVGGREGLALRVSAGIGYDVEWRQVHDLMKSAALATEHILDDPAPIVIQNELGDFAVQYELVAWTDDPKSMVRTRSELRQNVLDRFNEAGVEIMTPNVNAVRNAKEPMIPAARLPAAQPPALRFLDLQGGAP